MKTISLIAALAFACGFPGFKAQAYDRDDWPGYRHHERHEYRHRECNYVWVRGHGVWCHREWFWIPGHYERIW
ncbi:MAG: hypothetical protein WCH43_04410 [Verrucomicrobiota bacterium]